MSAQFRPVDRVHDALAAVIALCLSIGLSAQQPPAPPVAQPSAAPAASTPAPVSAATAAQAATPAAPAYTYSPDGNRSLRRLENSPYSTRTVVFVPYIPWQNPPA